MLSYVPKGKHDCTIKARIRQWEITKGIQSKFGHELPNSITGGIDDVMRHQCKENKYIALTDIPGVFLHADMEEEVHMLLEGTIAELISSSTQSYIENTNGEIKTTNLCYM